MMNTIVTMICERSPDIKCNHGLSMASNIKRRLNLKNQVDLYAKPDIRGIFLDLY